MKQIFVVIDMNNGFAKKGNLYSPNVEKIILPIKDMLLKFKSDSEIIYYSDAHEENDEEFNFYPPHCLKGSEESEYVDELKGLENYYIEKNTTNGFNSRNPLDIVKNKNADIYVCGCVTDICVLNFVKSMVEYIKNNRKKNNVYVLKDLVATFDGVNNDAEERHNNALKEMSLCGAKIVNSDFMAINKKVK